jgi:FRG domain
MPECQAHTWEKFEDIVRVVEDLNKDSLYPLLFRGHRSACWSLQSTLERRKPNKFPVLKYYESILRCKPEIETFTGLSWELCRIGEICNLVKDYDRFSLMLDGVTDDGRVLGVRYMAYLRHHGFPSPLLDWSKSPYVAAYLAFKAPGAQNRAVYILAEKPHNIKGKSSNEASIYSFRGVPKPHKRHYLQQSEYTACVQFDLKEGWSFVPYETIEGSYIGSLESWQDQDVIFKITMPSDIRLEILKRLDKFNLNAFSLFASEESLMETMAFREIDLK